MPRTKEPSLSLPGPTKLKSENQFWVFKFKIEILFGS